MPPTIYRAMPAALQVNRRPSAIPYAGTCLGTVWSEPLGDDHAILLLADTPEVRARLAQVGILVQERPAQEVAA